MNEPKTAEELAFWMWQSHIRFILCGKYNPCRLKEIYRELDLKYEDATEESRKDCRFWADKMREIFGK